LNIAKKKNWKFWKEVKVLELRKEKVKFSLNPHCFLVKGAKRGAIYDLTTGDIYSIDEKSVEILDKCEKGISLSQIIQETPGVNSQEIIDYLKNLKSLKLGRFLDHHQVVEKIPLSPPEMKLNFVWLELTQNCNLKCLHCYVKGSNNKENGSDSDLLNIREWKRIIKEGYDLGCRQIQFIGGEPMLLGKKIFTLIELARILGYELIELFSNLTLLAEEDINLLVKYNVQVATSIYSKRAEIHDCITTRKGSFNQTINNVRKLQAKGLKVRFATIVMKQNEEYIKETADFLNELGNSDCWRSFDVVRPIGRGVEEGIVPKKLTSWRLQTKPVFPKITKEEFIRRKNGHSCWQNKLCITSNGQVIPCIMAREKNGGNVKTQTLSAVLNNGHLQNYWRLSKDGLYFSLFINSFSKSNIVLFFLLFKYFLQ
jgi:MoaA/NifB/PqqE/SkfB family radical SAM enzyme